MTELTTGHLIWIAVVISICSSMVGYVVGFTLGRTKRKAS